MSLPPGGDPNKPKLTATRIVIWLAVAGAGLYLVISGIVGILAKG
ncbi:MAG TPA: hypothetical protein VFQ74_02290 [Pseudolysinimonas sp.]|nr:hypothetical protein [Pseudolysinimonas sp.]